MALNPYYSIVPDNPDLVMFADKILDRIHAEAVPLLKDHLSRQDIVLTEKLLRGLKRSVNQRYQEKVVEYVLEMDLHGQFQDYRKIRYTGRPNFNQDGIGFFDYALKGYQKNGWKNFRPFTNLPAYALKTPEASVRYMAFGAVVNIQKTATVTRPSSRSGWFKKYFEEIISPMNRELLLASEAVAMHESELLIKKALNERG